MPRLPRLLAGLLGLILPLTTMAAAEQRAEVQVEAQLSADEAWALLQDFSLAHNYVPGLSRTEIMSAAKSGPGAHRRVYDEDGDYLEETITEWREGEGFIIRLHQGDEPMAPFEQVGFSYGLAPAENDQTLITLALVFEMPWGRFGELLGEWFILPFMEDNLVQVAAGMKSFYETGQPATDADRDRLAPLVRVTSDAGER